VLLAAADWLPDSRVVDPDRLEFVLTLTLASMTIAIGLRERYDARVVARWRNRLLLLACTLALSLPALEFATRVMFRDVTTSSDFGGYFSRRWMRADVQLNVAGFRERRFAEVKPPGTYRIAVVGDSFTYGNGIRREDRFSDLIQARLPASFEVLNFGQPGANTPQHLHKVSMILERNQPDFVLLQWYVNDVEDDDVAHRPAPAPLLPIRRLHGWLSNVSAFYTVANMQWAEAQVVAGVTESYEAYLKRRLDDPNSADSKHDRALLSRLIALCKQRGVPIGIVMFPDTAASLDETYPFGYLHDRVRDVCAEQGITCVDLRGDFSHVRPRRELWASRLDHHPSARANAIAAEKILGTYAKTWVTSPQR
jgi:hypothetical protein